MQADLAVETMSEAEADKRARIQAVLALAETNRPFEVYVLIDIDGAVKYVGSSKDARQRLRWHWTKRNGSRRSPAADWLVTLTQPPRLVIIDWPREDERYEVERRWIAYFRQIYPDLLNVFDPQHICPEGDDAPLENELAATLRVMRLNAALTLKQLADETGLSTNMIRDIEHGRKIPHSARAVSDWVWATGAWDREGETLDLWRRTPTPETERQREVIEYTEQA
jgi:hypothetical protein